MTGWIIAALALLAGGVVASRLHRAATARRQRRAGYFSRVSDMFDAPVSAIAPTGFPRLSGRHDGALYDLQVVPDTLTFRKLPALWLLVSLPEATPVQGTVDIMMRPMGGETFSHFNDLPVQIAIPPGFPPDCAIRCDSPAALPDMGLILHHLSALDLNGLKELLISPKGLRIVWLAEEANRSRYLLFRDAEMGMEPLAPARLTPILAALAALRADLAQRLAA